MTTTLLPSDRQAFVAPTIYKLANGVRVIAEQVPVDAVTLDIWINVGSANESDDINGMAHFLEHMIFKGSDRQSVGEFERVVESRGGNTNAATSQDYTHYYITVAPQDFAELAPLQIDLVLNARIPDPEFQRERLVVLEEIRRSEDNPDRRLYRHTAEMAYQQLPYRRPVLGPSDAIANLTSDQMRDFHRQWYSPENITVVVVGNLTVAQMISVVSQAFEQLPCNSRTERQTLQREAPFQEIERQEVIDRSLQRSRLVMTWRVPGLYDLNETYPLNVLASILSGGRTSRLVKDLREDRGLVDRIAASNSTQAWQGTFQISAKLESKRIPVVEMAIREHLQRLYDEPVSSEELDKIRTQVSNRFIFANESPRDRTGIYGYYDRVVGNLEAALKYPEQVNSVTAQDIQSAVRRYINPDAYGILSMMPSP
ncbi:M16 family metallopeptidase [Pseudanabaena sp. PCC 6802]|uniref:M16 family metallopeptidase n=1 Tax=Pseudanabaena sp. PCC 6802 TaxID=118173 RepID=UPI00034B496A|nr:pitrilysin family protein [Pseudanabaena sp. PCC 6802]